MVMGIWTQVAQLRDLLSSMERDLGLDSLSSNERDILLAFYANAAERADVGYVCTTDKVRAHPTVSRISQPTFHRTLRRLLDKGLVIQSDDLPLGTYVLPSESPRA
ncbi:hypothetical protein SAMN04488045_2747 [Thalassococcus halodurans]|jgi:DNA-binding MarR family transcriptional regulator|uniref:MarR family protein n=3 Tax=Thalassococcus TaxID=436357 RepID=A0A1H6A1U1_9RHOB|nr:hypothetical protein SAMN04488045_2747 [Thalassococcus halodurans]